MAKRLSIQLFFLRHGRAVAREDWTGTESRRPLTKGGVALMRREAQALAALDLGLDLIVTSPLERARRTAEIAADALGMKKRLVSSKALAHGFSLRALAGVIASRPNAARVMLVGHEPDFSRVVSELVGGGRITLRKGAVARVDVAGTVGPGRGRLVWLLQPETLAR